MKEAVIRKPIVDYVYRYLRSKGIDTGALESRYAFQPSGVDGLDPALPTAQFFQLFEEAAEITGDQDIGLRIYLGVDWRDLGLFAYAHMNARTVEEALKINVRYQCMMQNHTALTLEHCPDGGLIYSYKIADAALPECRYDNDLSISGAIYPLRDLTGKPDWSPHEVHFIHHRPADISAYQQLLCCPLKFAMPTNRLYIDAEMAATPIVGGDNKLFALLEAELQRLSSLTGEEDKMVREVEEAVAHALSTGVPSIETIASRLGMGQRSLQRRLGESGHTFKGVVEETRKQLAQRYLASTDHPLVEVAFLVGYSELSAFIRAFRRWTGQTPQQYRLKYSR